MRLYINKIVVFILLVIIIALIYIIYAILQKLKKVSLERLHFETSWKIETKWLENIYNEKKISNYLTSNGYKSAAIYGIGYMGKFLADDIICNIEIKYIVDKNSNIENYKRIPVIRPCDISLQNEVDILIITAVSYYDEIFEELCSIGCDMDTIVSLDDILWSL